VTADQLTALEEYAQIWSVWRPDLFRRIRVTAAAEVAARAAPTGDAVLGFSGGVDASFALVAHQQRLLGRRSRRLGLAVLVVGFDLRHGDSAALARARATAAESLNTVGVPLAVVATNWQHDLCPDWFMSFTAGLAGVLHTMSGRCSAAVVATDHNARRELSMTPYGSHLAINHLLGSPAFPIVSTGTTHSRLERVAVLGDHPVLLRGLRVCYQADAGGGNCGRCEKCVRTQVELRACGIPARGLFREPMRIEDVEAVTTRTATAVDYLADALAALDPADAFAEPLRRTVRRERLRHAEAVGAPAARVAKLETALAQAVVERDEIRASRSWRIAAPARAVTSRARDLRPR
jgi:hypothetical protein